jgi:Dehydrogenases with different specificities (related to short-chain alcohol dehydrogenases)
MITGANSGIGFATARLFAKNGYRVILAVRDKEKGESAKKAIQNEIPSAKLEVLELNLASQKSIRNAAETFLRDNDRLDVLINNAGLFSSKYTKTEDGLEMVYGVNYVGAYYFTMLLLDLLCDTAKKHKQAHIISVSSYGYKSSEGLDFTEPWRDKSQYKAQKAYGDSKLSLIYFTQELARRYGAKGIVAQAINPGTVRTNLIRSDNMGKVISAVLRVSSKLFPFLALSPDKPADAILYLTESTEAKKQNGRYWDLKKSVTPKFPGNAEKQSSELWDRSYEYTAFSKE